MLNQAHIYTIWNWTTSIHPTLVLLKALSIVGLRNAEHIGRDESLSVLSLDSLKTFRLSEPLHGV